MTVPAPKLLKYKNIIMNCWEIRLPAWRYEGKNRWFTIKRRQNYCRASLSLSPFLHISLQTSILQLLLVNGMWWFSIPHMKMILVGHHLFNSGQEERRLSPWHFKKVTGERTSSLPAGRLIWPWQSSGSWDFFWRRAQPGMVPVRTDGERTSQQGPRCSPTTGRPVSGTESSSPGNKIGYKENEPLWAD